MCLFNMEPFIKSYLPRLRRARNHLYTQAAELTIYQKPTRKQLHSKKTNQKDTNMGATAASDSTETMVVALCASIVIVVAVLLTAFVIGPKCKRRLAKDEDPALPVQEERSTSSWSKALLKKLPGLKSKSKSVSSDEESLVGTRPEPIKPMATFPVEK